MYDKYAPVYVAGSSLFFIKISASFHQIGIHLIEFFWDKKSTDQSIGGFYTKKLCTAFDNRYRSGNGVGDSSKVSPWHTPTPV